MLTDDSVIFFLFVYGIDRQTASGEFVGPSWTRYLGMPVSIELGAGIGTAANRMARLCKSSGASWSLSGSLSGPSFVVLVRLAVSSPSLLALEPCEAP